VRPRLAETLIRDDVGGDIQRGLNRDLQRVPGEAFLDLVGRNVSGTLVAVGVPRAWLPKR
jgi:hypothetical protein